MFKELLIAYTPENLYYRIRCRKNFKHWNKHNSIFVHIPKNGGTTESIAKYGEFLGHVPFAAIEKNLPSLTASKHFYGYYRDPVERFLSAYNYANNGASEVTSRFRRFNASKYQGDILTLVATLQKLRLEHCDPIFKPQSFYVSDRNNVQRVKLSKLYLSRNIKNKGNADLYQQIKDEVYSNLELIEAIRKLYKNDYLLTVQQ